MDRGAMFFIDSFFSACLMIRQLDPELFAIISVSLTVSGASTLIAALFGIPLGGLVGLVSFPGREAVRMVLHTLLAVPTVVIGLLVYACLSRRGILGSWGLLYTRPAIVIGQVFLILPLIAALVSAAVERVDPKYQKTAVTLGAGRIAAGLVVFQEALPAVGAALLTAFGRVISEVGISMMLGGNVRGFTRTMTTAMALEYDKGEFVLAVALGLVLLGVSFALNLTLAVFRGAGERGQA